MTLAILPQCPTWEGQSTVNKATGIGLKSGPLTWGVCPGFTLVKNVLSASCLDQLPVFRSGGMWMLTMLWDGALQWTYNSIGLLCGAKGFKGTSLRACFLLILVQTLWCYLCSCSSFPWEIPWKARTVNFHFEFSLSIFGWHTKLSTLHKAGFYLNIYFPWWLRG